MIRKASDTADAIKKTMTEVKDQIGIMSEQLSMAEAGSKTEEILKQDIEAAKADLKMMNDVAKSASSRTATSRINRTILNLYMTYITDLLFGDEEQQFEAANTIRTNIRRRKPVNIDVPVSEEAKADFHKLMMPVIMRLINQTLGNNEEMGLDEPMPLAARRASRSGLRKSASIEARNKVRLANILDKLAGIVEDVDLSEDISAMGLEEVEKAVDSLYGDQSKNDTYYFERRGK